MTFTKEISTTDVPRWLRVLVTTSISFALLLILLYFLKFGGSLSSKQEAWGQFGDYAGGILNPLFSVTALFALLYTIVLQSKELRDSTVQLKRSAVALDAQNAVLTKQAFETTFFQMMILLNDLVRDMHVKVDYFELQEIAELEKYEIESGGNFDNRQCIEALQKILLAEYLVNVTRGNYTQPAIEAIDIEYGRFYKRYGHLVGHYFRTIYNILKFVDSGFITDEQKKFYTNLVRAQLSKYELGLLFYNCLSRYGREKFLPLVVKYRLLKHLENGVLSNAEHRKLVKQL
ncbi:MAG: hypothetical protein CVU36_07890 [Betaproteobacteria bacterium HGW-Betaproteobacteria-9]|jgi:hypothetical protein|nr:MAG: hypothetical protein CVU36_07890 [Betaproteobacteria bacterium HGW-Betaproteobacteria-9]